MRLLALCLAAAMPVRQPRPMHVPSMPPTAGPGLSGAPAAIAAAVNGGKCPHCNCEVLRMARHLRMCPKLAQLGEMQALPFFRRNVNLGSDEVLPSTADDLLGTQPDAALVLRVVAAHEHARHLVRREPLALPTDGERPPELEMSQREAEKARHALQCDAIVRELRALGVIGTGHCHVEVGAGSAGLSLALARADGGRADAHVLLDQYLPRQKADKLLRAMGARHERHKLLLEHLDLDALQASRLAQHGEQITVVSKHLCGAATDFALRAAAGCETPVAAFAIASCCHHRCDYAAYPNRAFFERAGFDARDFARIARMSSWAVNAPHQDGYEAGGAALLGARGQPLRRQELGRLCKDLLDIGRVLYLRGAGLDAWLAEYVSERVTPENVLLLARPVATAACACAAAAA
jgi:tRNA:m4X modification enzyme